MTIDRGIGMLRQVDGMRHMVVKSDVDRMAEDVLRDFVVQREETKICIQSVHGVPELVQILWNMIEDRPFME